jgi:hypothetical protein
MNRGIDAKGDVSHADLMDELRALRADMGPLTDPAFQSDLREVVEIVRAARVGGKGLTWLANMIKALLVIGGLWLAFKAGLAALANSGG